MPARDYRHPETGEKLKGTTSILGANLGWNKGPLMWWAHKQGLAGIDYNKIRDEAAGSGTIAHYLAECHVRGIKPDYSTFDAQLIPPAEAAFSNFLEWWKGMKVEVVAIELALVHDELGYGSTLDLVARLNGNSLSILDYKTSRGVYADYLLQMISYVHNYEHNTGETVDRVDLARFDKEDARFVHYMWDRDVLEELWPAFVALIEVEKVRLRAGRLVK